MRHSIDNHRIITKAKGTEQLKLHLGCGPRVLPGWLNVDRQKFAVGGYSPVQAVLKFREIVERGERFEVGILQVQDDNIFRVVNGFRPVLVPRTTRQYAFQPYMKDGRLVPQPASRDYSQFLELVHNSFRTDYFAPPTAQFPYTFSLVQAIMSGSPWRRLRFAFLRWKSHYRDPYLTRNLTLVLTEFVTFARAHGITPVVVFVPLGKDSYLSSQSVVNQLNRELGAGVAFEFTDADIDWSHYNLKKSSCHPSPYGYARLAKFISDVVLVSNRRHVAHGPQ